MFSFHYHCQDFYRSWLYIYEYYGGCFIRSRNCLPFMSTWVQPRFFGGICVAHFFCFFFVCVALLCVFMFWLLCFDIRYDFRIKRCSVHLYLQLFVIALMSYLRYLCFLTCSGVQHILCCVFVLFFFVLCALCCQFLSIVHFWSSLRYTLTFI